MRYPVVLTKDDNDTILVTFPDVPGAVTFGETKEEALARAPDALLTVFDALMKDRRDLPEPSTRRGPAIEIGPLDVAKIELYRAMRHQRIGKAELARRLDVHLPQVDRLLAMKHFSRLDLLQSALQKVGKRLRIVVEDEADDQRSAAPKHRRGVTA